MVGSPQFSGLASRVSCPYGGQHLKENLLRAFIVFEFCRWQFDQLSFQQLALAWLVRQPLELLERQQRRGRDRTHASILHRALSERSILKFEGHPRKSCSQPVCSVCGG